MARPTTKNQLIEVANENFAKLLILIDSISKEDQIKEFAFEDRDRNIRDVLIHLYEWHQLLLNWIKSNKSGQNLTFLPESYNWKTYPKMNLDFWEKHQQTPLDNAITLLRKSHTEAMSLIETFSNEELFTNKYFTWTGTSSLGAYCVSSTSSHYDWAIKKIKKHKKSLS